MQDPFSTEIAEEMRTWTSEERMEAAALISDTEQTPGFEMFAQILAGIRKRKMNALLATDKPREASEYARDLGEINGLRIVEAIVATVKQKGKDADEQLERLAGAAAQEAR